MKTNAQARRFEHAAEVEGLERAIETGMAKKVKAIYEKYDEKGWDAEKIIKKARKTLEINFPSFPEKYEKVLNNFFGFEGGR